MSRISLYEKCKRFVEAQSEGAWPPELVERDVQKMMDIVIKEKKSAKRPKKVVAVIAKEASLDGDARTFIDADKIDPGFIEALRAGTLDLDKFDVDSLMDSDDNDEIENEVSIEEQSLVSKHTAVEDFAPVTPVEAPKELYPILSDLPPPPERKHGGYRQEKFPFSKLEVGKGFIIPATEAKPEPWKSYQSTVSGAQRRFAKVVGTKVKKDGKEVEAVEYTKRFRIYEETLADGSKVAIVMRTA